MITIAYNAGMAKRPAIRMSDQLRRIIDDCGLSRYEISKRTGIAASTLSQFMHGQRGLSMKALDKLTDCLGLTVNMQKRSRR